MADMPQHTACEQCRRVGLVRLERIITGTRVTLSYLLRRLRSRVANPHTRSTEGRTPSPARTGERRTTIGLRARYPRPMNGIFVAITVMNCTFASSGRLAI